MNFLAHLALAGPSELSRIGNLLGDFEKGTLEALRERLHPEVVEGIIMHRRIDAFTDSHPVFREARNLMMPERRRFAGIAIDIFFDHFLSVHWTDFHPGSVSEFIAQIYLTFDRNEKHLGRELRPLVPRLKSENWLAAYRDEEGLARTLQRVASRSHRLEILPDAMTDFSRNSKHFEKLFLVFYPEIRIYAASLLGKNRLETPAFP